MKKIERALISVSDKSGLIPFARALAKQKIEILSTGGTLKALKAEGIPATAVDEFTGFPEMLDGRVKTLHPKIHGGLLYRRDKKDHVAEAKAHGIKPIDLVVVNLYPFEVVTANPDVAFETAIENIDIGGPSMLRSASKNFDSVTVVTDPADYSEVLQEIMKNGVTSLETRKRLALKVFERTAAYDKMIANYLAKTQKPAEEKKTDSTPVEVLPPVMDLIYEKAQDLRYGENPHQPAAYYVAKGKTPKFKQLHGKELSFNNLLDIEATMDITREFSAPAACVIKHNNPCGVAEGKTAAEALQLAVECDLMSAFGGIIGINRPCDLKTAETAFDALKFFEVFVAPSFSPEALEFMKKRQNLRIISTGNLGEGSYYDYRFLENGLLVQTKDRPLILREAEVRKHLRVVTKAQPSADEIESLLFAFKCVKVVKSNAIVITQGRQTVGIGAGQMSRVDSVDIACRKAGYRTDGGFLASDAFFPMPDSIEVAAEHKIKAIIQPGGSIKDADVVAACDQFNIAMVLTGERHFRH